MAEESGTKVTAEEVVKMFKKTGFIPLNPKENMITPIFGYWHILLVNHYYDIVSEQLQVMLDSELYSRCENIYVGMLGDNEGMKKIIELFSPYPKIIVSEYSTNKENFEFQTLQILKEHADKSKENYYLFYIHTKSVSFSEESNPVAFHGGKHWRKHMDEWTLSKWEQNVAALDSGYETCGTQLRPRREWREHYSGNYFWARSEYVKLLKPVYSLNIKDRYESEFYICSAFPVAATLDQTFIDYYSPDQSLFLKPRSIGATVRVKKQRTVVHTLAWNTVDEVERATKSLYKLNNKNDFEHIIVSLNFPLRKSDEVPDDIEEAKEDNRILLKALAQAYGSRYVEMENKGVSQNWSTIYNEEGLGEGDVLICCDPDEKVHPKAVGWVKAMADVIRSDQKYGVVSLIMQEQFKELNKNNSEEKNVGGQDIIEVHGALMWGQIGVDCGLLKKIGGVPYPNGTPIYGGLEFALLEKMDKYNYKWCFLKDKIFKHPDWNFNDLTRQWKHHILDEKNGKQIHFEDYLRLKQQGKV